MEVASRKTHDDYHKYMDERRADDKSEADEKAATNPMGRFPQTSQLRSDGEWPK
jgi:hypothetical protein